ncbi:hypothetical protein SDC9_150917 [bioreactor metagenome]|uniref:RNA polymerase alpha subunit C-terminal domain-containing protein n=1 Tax=bioreactor metagenome TaxID=1076179 RepID=A0A645ENU0_9ZZZZ|nr:hypothetical protein [Lutispora sp.]MEA4962393.1 hypothetical protein [Lutispora sp.]
MNQELWQYFNNCTVVDKGIRIHAGTQLVRSGLTDMEILCEMLEHEPNKVLKIRNIGMKSIIAIQKVCEAYRRERGGMF